MLRSDVREDDYATLIMSDSVADFLIMNVYHSAKVGPVIQPGCIVNAQVHAAMTHGGAEITVPVRTVQAVITMEIHDIGDIWKIITRAAHIPGAEPDVHLELSGHRGGPPCAC